MQKLGYQIHVIAKIHDFQNRKEIESAFQKEGIPLELMEHPKHPTSLFLKNVPRVLMSPALIDGAALEYADPAYEALVKRIIETFKPNVVWIEYTPLWPIMRIVNSMEIPCIMKSSLNEPANCRDENGWSVSSVMKSLPKYWGEKIAAKESDFLFGITPVEEQWYRSWGAKHTGTLPLRGLSQCFDKKTHTDKEILDVVFLSSNYNMGHNRDAYLFLVEKVIPLVRKNAPGKFRFHLTGKKFPERFQKYLADDVRAVGFVDDLGTFLSTMDIALCPWISGHGMQQKVFEPLCRSLPLITNKVAGYPFENGTEVLLGTSPEEFFAHLMTLRDASTRQRMADAASQKAWSLFSEEAVMQTVDRAVQQVLARKA